MRGSFLTYGCFAYPRMSVGILLLDFFPLSSYLNSIVPCGRPLYESHQQTHYLAYYRNPY
jgi:hypothetical protein